ncbi:MAG TPA: transcriptional regulator [Actinomycetota bacterium]|nr:transcriptional regulator [Actinomycetota bacterium]
MVAQGWNDCRISRATEINRTTIREWRTLGPPGSRPTPRNGSGLPSGRQWCPRCGEKRLDEPAHAYLLGLYLGDGFISRDPRTYRLRIFQDTRYGHLIELARHAIARVRGGDIAKVALVQERGCVAISSYWNHWPCVFPQHGPGMKHQRPIRLADWQCEIVSRYPRQHLRGLIHSDGCRVMNRVRKGKYAYPRYFFTNTSTDILEIFRDACDRIGVPHRDSKWNTISVARKEGVAMLDAFIGSKS